jgi:hypothetical protein
MPETAPLRELLPDVPAPLLGRPELGALAFALGVAPARQGDYRRQLGHNLLLGHALDQALGAFQERRVAVQPVKGARLLDGVYRGHPGARRMGDLDLLVRPADASPAGAALRQLGYTTVGATRLRFSPSFTHHDIYVRGEVVIELHYRLCHELAVAADVGSFFRDTEERSFRGLRLALARDELHLFYTLLHAATHGLVHDATWIIDTVLQARAAPALDWTDVEREARARRAVRLLHAAARHVNAWFPGTLPFARPPRGVRDRLLERLAPPGAPPIHGGEARSLAIRALLTDGRRDAVRVLGAKLWLRALEAAGRPRRD